MWRRRAAGIGLVVYFVVMAWLVFGPRPNDEAARVAGAARQAGAVVTGSPTHRPATVGTTPTPDSDSDAVLGLGADEFSNVVLFVPLPVLVALWRRRRWWWSVPAGVALSVTIELLQRLWFIDRTSSLGDVWFNTIGVLVGAGLGALGLALADRRWWGRAGTISR